MSATVLTAIDLGPSSRRPASMRCVVIKATQIGCALLVLAAVAAAAQPSFADQLKITIDTFHDHRNAFYFSTNPLGAYKDANTVENGRSINYDWNAVWNNKTTIDDKGWYVEMAIPLTITVRPADGVARLRELVRVQQGRQVRW